MKIGFYVPAAKCRMNPQMGIECFFMWNSLIFIRCDDMFLSQRASSLRWGDTFFLINLFSCFVAVFQWICHANGQFKNQYRVMSDDCCPPVTVWNINGFAHSWRTVIRRKPSIWMGGRTYGVLWIYVSDTCFNHRWAEMGGRDGSWWTKRPCKSQLAWLIERNRQKWSFVLC